MSKSDILKEKLLSTLKETNGMINETARRVGCSKSTYQKYRKTDKDFDKKVKSILREIEKKFRTQAYNEWREEKGDEGIEYVTFFIKSPSAVSEEFRNWSKANFKVPSKLYFDGLDLEVISGMTNTTYSSAIGRSVELLVNLSLCILYRKNEAIEEYLDFEDVRREISLRPKIPSKKYDYFKVSKDPRHQSNKVLYDPIYKNFKSIFGNYSKYLDDFISSLNISRELVICICESNWRKQSQYVRGAVALSRSGGEDKSWDEYKNEFKKQGWGRHTWDDNYYIEVYEKYVEEVFSIYNKIDWDKLKPKIQLISTLYLDASMLVGEIDMVIDNKIIDIKTNSELKISRFNLNQIICYYFMVRTFHSDKIYISGIGLYFARFDYLWSFNLDEISPLKMKKLSYEFKELMIKQSFKSRSEVKKEFVKDKNMLPNWHN